MSIPGWLLKSLISFTSVAVAAVPMWLWLALPRQTAAAFIAAIEAGHADRANGLLTNGKWVFIESPEGTRHQFVFEHGTMWCLSDAEVRFCRRGLTNALQGRQVIRVDAWGGETGLRFSATCDGVTPQIDGLFQTALRNQQALKR
jgi:hypothetical protein